MTNLTSMAKELLIIDEDITWRFRGIDLRTYELHTFEQVWPDTSCGFGGVAGQAFTSCNVYAFVPNSADEYGYKAAESLEKVIVYIGSRFAYAVPKATYIMEDITAKNVRSVLGSSVYLPD